MGDTDTNLRHVKLVSTNDNFTGARLWIDGKEPECVYSIDVHVGANEVNKVTIVFSPDELDIEVDEGASADGQRPQSTPGKPTT